MFKGNILSPAKAVVQCKTINVLETSSFRIKKKHCHKHNGPSPSLKSTAGRNEILSYISCQIGILKHINLYDLCDIMYSMPGYLNTVPQL